MDHINDIVAKGLADIETPVQQLTTIRQLPEHTIQADIRMAWVLAECKAHLSYWKGAAGLALNLETVKGNRN